MRASCGISAAHPPLPPRSCPQLPPVAPRRPQAPPGAPRRPQAPPGAPRRPQAPPGAPRRPQAPPGVPRRAQAPPGAPRRPQAPPGAPPRAPARPRAPPGNDADQAVREIPPPAGPERAAKSCAVWWSSLPKRTGNARASRKRSRPSRAQTILCARFRAAECPGRRAISSRGMPRSPRRGKKNEEGEEGDEGEEGEEGEEKNTKKTKRKGEGGESAVNCSTLREQTAGSPP